MKKISLTIICVLLAFALMADSRGWTIVQSLALPGLGQVRNDRSYGYAMLGAEVGVIGSMFFLSSERNLKDRESYDYALKYANLQPGSYPESFFFDLTKYYSSDFTTGGYNEMVRQEALRLYPTDPVAQQAYIDANGYDEDHYWKWESPANRSEYASMRHQMQNLQDYGKIAVGVLIVNHIISGMDALIFTRPVHKPQAWLKVDNDTPLLMLSMEF